MSSTPSWNLSEKQQQQQRRQGCGLLTWLLMPRDRVPGDMPMPERKSGEPLRRGERASTGLRHRPAASARYPSALLRRFLQSMGHSSAGVRQGLG